MNDRKTQNAMCRAANSATYQKTGQANVVLTDIWPVVGVNGAEGLLFRGQRSGPVNAPVCVSMAEYLAFAFPVRRLWGDGGRGLHTCQCFVTVY